MHIAKYSQSWNQSIDAHSTCKDSKRCVASILQNRTTHHALDREIQIDTRRA